jgi:hypothetical protein
MTDQRNALDANIDRVAARLVDVRDDAELTARIISALPDRTSGWWRWMPQVGAACGVVLVIVFWTTREASRPEPVAPMREWPPLRAALDPVEPYRPAESASARGRRGELQRDKPVEPLVPVDFERSLPAMSEPRSIELDALTTGVLPTVPGLELSPLAVSELPMTAELFIPREQ